VGRRLRTNIGGDTTVYKVERTSAKHQKKKKKLETGGPDPWAKTELNAAKREKKSKRARVGKGRDEID